MRVIGAVLAGGEARRFGADKAAALLNGRALIDHAAAALSPYCEQVIVVGREWPGFMCVLDRPTAGLGPLGGLNAALYHAAGEGADAVLSVGCDTPHIPGDLLRQLLAEDAAFLEGLPVIGYWPTRLARALDEFVSSDPKRSIRGWAAQCGAQAISSPPLPNINTPDDLAQLVP